MAEDDSFAAIALKLDAVLGRLSTIEDRQEHADDKITRIWEELHPLGSADAQTTTRRARRVIADRHAPLDARETDTAEGKQGKDSSGNYVRVRSAACRLKIPGVDMPP